MPDLIVALEAALYIDALIGTERMTADEARGLPLVLNVTLEDFRSDRRQPLPDFTSPTR